VSAVDVETWWQRLASAALVGTGRRPSPSVADVDLHGFSTPRTRVDARPEEVALDAAALGGALRRAGRVPATGTDLVPAAPPEQLPEAPARARQLFDLLLNQPPTDAVSTEALLLHWLATCREAGCRVPHQLLPALLARATSKALRVQVPPVIGERGAWLAMQNPDWSWVQANVQAQAASTGTDASVDPHRWALLPRDLRVQQLRETRLRDPAAGRDLLVDTWPRESAKDRRALLEALLVNLGNDDEALLERALDDRAASVRELGAQMLDALPESRRAARMAERLRPLIGEHGLLRRHLEVRLPDDPDAAGRRDGLGKQPRRRSARGWWLERIVAGAPFDVWGDPENVISRIDNEDVLSGLRTAAMLRRDPAWARALLDRAMDPELIAVLPPTEREQRVSDELARTPDAGVPALLTSQPPPWSPRLSSAVIARLARLEPEHTGQVLESLMPLLVRGVHPDAIGALQRWRAQARLPARYDRQIGSLIQSRTLRHTISEAFLT
jgi:hypothetical protein